MAPDQTDPIQLTPAASSDDLAPGTAVNDDTELSELENDQDDSSKLVFQVDKGKRAAKAAEKEDTELSELDADQTDGSKLAFPATRDDRAAEVAADEETELSRLAPDRTDISLPVVRADQIEHAVPGERRKPDREPEPEFEAARATDDEDISLVMVERDQTSFTGHTSQTDPQQPGDQMQALRADAAGIDELALIDTTRHRIPGEDSKAGSVTRTSATTGITLDTQTAQGGITRTESTTTRTYAPDNYDRTLMKLPSDDASKIFAGMKPESDVVMTPDYAKKVFRSKSSAQRMQHYKIYSGIGIAILLSAGIYGAFEFQAESDNIDAGLRPLKRDPMPGVIRSGIPDQGIKLFTEPESGVNARTLEMIENAETAVSGGGVAIQSAEVEPAVVAVEAEAEMSTASVEPAQPESEVAMTNVEPAQPEPEAAVMSPVRAPAEPTISIQVSSISGSSGSETKAASSQLQISSSSRVEQKHTWLREAYAAYKSGNDELALTRYKQVLAVDPGNRNALLGRAAIYIQTSDTAGAIKDYQTILLASPRDSFAMASLVAVASFSPQDTETQLKLMIRDEPDSPHLNFALANAYSAQNRWREAQRHYFQALQNNSSDPNYAYNLAVSLEHISQPGTAIVYYRRALDNFENGLATFSRDVVDQRLELLAKP